MQKLDNMNLEEELKIRINNLLEQKDRVLIALDGRCASGKTTLAQKLSEELDANIIHMDDFFLRPCQRTKERLEKPGGNVDRERFFSEVLIPLNENKRFSYRAYNCQSGGFSEEIIVRPKRLTIVEGSYSCHPDLWDYYDLHVFLSVSAKVQLERIRARNPDSVLNFKKKWIPLEEKYFKAFHIMDNCELVIIT